MPALGLKMRIDRLTSLIASVYQTGLQMWHKFTATTWDGSTDRLPDSSPVGTNTAALYTGRGLSFDGVNDVVTVGATGTTVKTVVFYAYPDSDTTAFMQLQSTGAVRVEISTGTLSATGFTSPTLYVDGAASSTVAATTWQQIAVTSATGVSASNVLLGQSNTTYYGGDLSNVKFFSVELTAGQIAELYANPEQALPTGVSSGDLVGWWPMAEGAGLACYSANNNIQAGLLSGASWVNSIASPVNQISLTSSKKYMHFDGSNDFISGTADAAGTKLSVRAKAVNINDSGFQYIFYIGGITAGTAFGLARTSVEDLLYGFDGSAGYNSSYALPVGLLVDVVLTVNGTTMKMYVEGGLVLNTTVSSVNVTNLNYFIGRNSAGAGFSFWNGLLSEISFWNEELSSTDVTDLYAGALPTSIKSVNLQFWYKNNGNSNSDWLDSGNLSNNGTVSGSPGAIYTFTGVSNGEDYIGNTIQNDNNGELILNADGYALATDAATLDITTDITLEAWVKPFTVASLQSAIGKNSAYALNITAGAKLQFQRWSSTASGTVSSSASLTADTWYHIAATYDGTTTKLYINGTEDTSSGAVTGAIDSTATDVLLGALTTSTNLFSGYLDSVKVYDEVLTAAQIKQNYNAEKGSHSNS